MLAIITWTIVDSAIYFCGLQRYIEFVSDCE